MTDYEKIRALVRLTFRYRARLVGALACSVFVSFSGVGSIVMLKPVLDLLFNQADERPPLKYNLGDQDIQIVVGLPGVDPTKVTITQDGKRVEITAPHREGDDWFGDCYLPDKLELEEWFGAKEKVETKSSSWFGMVGTRDRLREIFHPFYIRLMHHIQRNRLLVLGAVAGVTLLLTIIKCLFSFAQLYLSNWIGQRVILDIRGKVFDHLLAMDMGFFSAHRSGELLSHLTIDAELLGSSVFAVFGQAMMEPLIIVGTLGVLFFLYPLLTTVYLLLLPLIVIVVAILGRRIRKARASTQGALGSMNALLQETFSSMPIVKAFGMQGERQQKFSVENRRIFRSHLRIVRARGVSNTLTESLGTIGVAGILMLGGFFVFQRGMEATSFLVYILALANLYHPIKRLNKAYNTIQQGMAGMDRVFAVLNVESGIQDAPDASDLSRLEREIVFDQVSFSYDGKTRVLTDVSVRIPKGSVVALVGPSGAGKSTLVSLIPRFHDPSAGRILIDGHELPNVTLRSIRDQIGLVPQETILFNDTVHANITCGNESYSPQQVEAAAQDAQAHSFIMELPNEYNAVVGERGCTLSGGQAQRVAIARALLKDPPIL
ncbi:MAG: ABC transporter transmembrane domain-containing protein, partial [bacterium]